MGTGQPRCGGVPAVAFASQLPPSHGCDHSGNGVYAADGVVLSVDNDDVVLMVTADGFGSVPGGRYRRSAVAGVTFLSGSSEGRHDAVGVYLSYPMALAFTDVGVAFTVHANGPGAEKACLGGGIAIAGPNLFSIPCERSDDPGRELQAAHSLVLNIGDE